MKIIAIQYDNDSEEGILTISDGEFECLAFCHPCNYQLNDIVNEPLRAFHCHEIMLSRGTKVRFEKLESSYFGYKKIVARVRSELCKRSTSAEKNAHHTILGGVRILPKPFRSSTVARLDQSQAFKLLFG